MNLGATCVLNQGKNGSSLWPVHWSYNNQCSLRAKWHDRVSVEQKENFYGIMLGISFQSPLAYIEEYKTFPSLSHLWILLDFFNILDTHFPVFSSLGILNISMLKWEQKGYLVCVEKKKRCVKIVKQTHFTLNSRKSQRK